MRNYIVAVFLSRMYDITSTIILFWNQTAEYSEYYIADSDFNWGITMNDGLDRTMIFWFHLLYPKKILTFEQEDKNQNGLFTDSEITMTKSTT